jgi:hypothetical protein
MCLLKYLITAETQFQESTEGRKTRTVMDKEEKINIDRNTKN